MIGPDRYPVTTARQRLCHHPRMVAATRVGVGGALSADRYLHSQRASYLQFNCDHAIGRNLTDLNLPNWARLDRSGFALLEPPQGMTDILEHAARVGKHREKSLYPGGLVLFYIQNCCLV